MLLLCLLHFSNIVLNEIANMALENSGKAIMSEKALQAAKESMPE